MTVSKWGNSLAIRLPAKLVNELKLKEGDQIEMRIDKNGQSQVSLDKKRQEALARLRSARWKIPPGYKFDREEANER